MTNKDEDRVRQTRRTAAFESPRARLRHSSTYGLALFRDLATPPASGILLSHRCHIPAQVQHITVEYERLPPAFHQPSTWALSFSMTGHPEHRHRGSVPSIRGMLDLPLLDDAAPRSTPTIPLRSDKLMYLDRNYPTDSSASVGANSLDRSQPCPPRQRMPRLLKRIHTRHRMGALRLRRPSRRRLSTTSLK